MTREDFELIAALPIIKDGEVRVKVRPEGFVLEAGEGSATFRTTITYAEAFTAAHPVGAFHAAAKMVCAQAWRMA